jgi:hypothetical protein
VIGPFTLHDLRLLVQLQKDHVSLCPVETLTRPQSPVWAAIVSLLPFNDGQSLTFVSSKQQGVAKQQPGFLQARKLPAQPAMYLMRLTPPLDSDENAQVTWNRMIGYAVTAVGERGIERIFACAGNESAERACLTAAGFNEYTQEDLYRLDAAPRRREAVANDIRPEQSVDLAGIVRLYKEVTPHRVQLAEPTTGDTGSALIWEPMDRSQGESFVLEDKDGIAGYGCLLAGRIGHWLRLLVHARAYDRASDLVDYGLALLDYYPPLPVYCGVREYQGGIRIPLEERRFQMFSTQCHMVRHTMARVKKPALGLVPALEKRVEAPTTTVSSTEQT